MLRIGEAAKIYDISNRTLRYWEEEGVLSSVRTENGYRFYDEENAARIRQIVLLRKLKMPVAVIEKVFIAKDVNAAIGALAKHLENLKREAAVTNALSVLVEKLIRHINTEKNLSLMFDYLQTQAFDTSPEPGEAPQILLSERDVLMSADQLQDVRIVRLPPMTVASYRAESETPEKDSFEVMNKFILENALHKKSGFRHFGFNNPSPSGNSPVYGYELWVAIPGGFPVPKPLAKKQFSGGLYASVATRMGEIGERWRQLSQWVTDSDKYDADPGIQCLEECTDFETFILDDESIQQLDLLEPIRQK